MPSESLYSERDRAAKASVMVKLRRGSLPQQEDMAIRQLVAGAVDRLSPENVVVVDADTDLPLNRFSSAAGSGGTPEIDQAMAKRVVETLEPVVGADVRASVHVEYDLSSGEETQETYDPASAVALSTTRSQDTLGGGAQGGVPGTSSNLPNAKVKAPANAAASQTESSSSESTTYGVNKLVRHTIQPAGTIKRISAALLVDDAVQVTQQGKQRTVTRRKRTLEEMKQIEGLAAASLGIDPKRGDVLAVENISFQGMQQDGPVAPTMVEKVQRNLHDWAWLLRYLALACLFATVYLLVLRPVKQQVLTALRALPGRVAGAPQLTAGAEAQKPGASAARKTESLEEILGISGGDDNPELRRLSALKSHLVEKVKAEPAGASRLVENWLREGGVE
jgi:flagellar M-ring protein FliF